MAGLMIPLCRAGRGRNGSHGMCVCSGSVVFHRGKLTFHMYTVDSGSWPLGLDPGSGPKGAGSEASTPESLT